MLQKFKEDFYIREHKYYYTPGIYMTEYYLNRRNLSYNFVDTARELARFFYFKMIANKKYVEQKYIDKIDLNDEQLELAAQKEEFYAGLWDKKIPGMSPMDKAINLLLIMRRKSKGKGIPLPTGKQTFQYDTAGLWDGVRDEEMFENTTYDELFQNDDQMEDFDKRADMLQRIGMVQQFGKSFDIKKVVEEKRVTNSDRYKPKRLLEYGELINSQLYQRMLPHYKAKLITKDLIVNSPIVTEESKQKIIMLVDFSGSMNSSHKQQWVKSIVADRLSYCMKEECELFFSFYLTSSELENNYFKWSHVYNKETALDFWKHFNDRPNGGDTQVGYIIDRIRTEILDNKRLFNLDVDLSKDKPEILVIQDGQDSVKTDRLTWKTNAITLYDGANSELGKLCKKTGGTYINIDHAYDEKIGK